jgi:tetratricopeptide (TPR) repeat protein
MIFPYFSSRTLVAGVVAALRITLAAGLACVLTGCATPGEREAAADEPAAQADDPNALELGAEVALQRGQYLEASRAYVHAAQLAQSEELAERATRIAYEHRQWSLVQTAAERWLQLNETNEEARRFAGFAALHLYRIDRAAEHLSKLLDTAFINPQAGFLALLPQLADEATPAGATAVLQKLATKYPDLTEAHYAIAQAALQSNSNALAYEHAKKAHELGPYWPPAGLLLARVQMVRGEDQAALETAKKTLEQDNQDAYRLEYALMQIQAGQEEAGRKELNILTTSDKVADGAERALADIDFQLGKTDSAAQRFSNLLSGGGRFVYESLFYLGAIAESRESWDDAIQIYQRVTGGDLAMVAQGRAARIKIERQGLDAGLKHLEEFASTRPQYRIAAITSRAQLLTANGDRNGALALLEQALKEYPDAVELRFAHIFQLEGANKVDQSIAEMRKLVADRPGDPAASNALGYTLVDRTRQHKEGVKLIEGALAETPDDGAVLDSMGWAMYRLGRHDEALKYLEQARRQISDPDVDLHLGVVLLALDRKQDARAVFEKAVERYPDNADLRERLEKLPK